MSISSEEVQVAEFARQCYSALQQIQQAIPQGWKEALEKYRVTISESAKKLNVNNSVALEIAIKKVEKQNISREHKQMESLFYMAAYAIL